MSTRKYPIYYQSKYLINNKDYDAGGLFKKKIKLPNSLDSFSDEDIIYDSFNYIKDCKNSDDYNCMITYTSPMEMHEKFTNSRSNILGIFYNNMYFENKMELLEKTVIGDLYIFRNLDKAIKNYMLFHIIDENLYSEVKLKSIYLSFLQRIKPDDKYEIVPTYWYEDLEMTGIISISRDGNLMDLLDRKFIDDKNYLEYYKKIINIIFNLYYNKIYYHGISLKNIKYYVGKDNNIHFELDNIIYLNFEDGIDIFTNIDIIDNKIMFNKINNKKAKLSIKINSCPYKSCFFDVGYVDLEKYELDKIIKDIDMKELTIEHFSGELSKLNFVKLLVDKKKIEIKKFKIEPLNYLFTWPTRNSSIFEETATKSLIYNNIFHQCGVLLLQLILGKNIYNDYMKLSYNSQKNKIISSLNLKKIKNKEKIIELLFDSDGLLNEENINYNDVNIIEQFERILAV